MQTEEIKQATSCATCGHALNGQFCSQCGEKVLKAEDKSILHFFEELFHMLTHADSKFLKSLKYIFTKPGFLTREHLDGRRKLYASPLSLFFIGNVIYLLFSPVDALNSHYKSQVGGQVYWAMAKAEAAKKMEQRHWTPVQMEDHYNEESGKISKLLLILLIFLFSVPIAILFYSRRSYYFDHVVFATEFVNFIIYGVLIIIPYLLAGIFLLINVVFKTRVFFDPNTTYAIVVLGFILLAYLSRATQRVYKQNMIFTIFKSILLILSTAVVIILYRFILFHATMAML